MSSTSKKFIMATFRNLRSNRKKIMVAAGIVGLVILILQKYVLNTEQFQPMSKECLNSKINEVKYKSLLEAYMTGNRSAGVTLPEIKTILMYKFPDNYKLQPGIGRFLKCDYLCTLTKNATLLNAVDSVVVDSHFVFKIQTKRSPGQIWVFFAVESPINSRNRLFQKPEWQYWFNWTVTYRRDSDLYFGYGDFVKAHSPVPTKNLSAVVAWKSKLVAWFVSNCHTQSKRDTFVAVLKEFVQVDIFGHCGTSKCGKEGDRTCMDMLSKNYYFYLAFENSICRDYLTEKLYRTMKMIDIVPVVRGGANYTSLLPRHSFIDASQFPSVKALADHLKRVASDRQMYESYLAWKHEWQVLEPFPFPFCELCQRLHHKDRWARVYPNIDSWWAEGQCSAPSAIVKS